MRLFRQAILTAGGMRARRFRRLGLGLALAFGGASVLTEAAARGELSQFIANSSVYLDMLGHVVIAWTWLKQAGAAQVGLAGAHADDVQFYAGKMQACRYFFRWELPKIKAQAALLSGLDTTCLDMPEEAF